jgi:hypothetical protein
MIDGQPGSDWTDDQNDLIVGDYFVMLAKEISGEHYVKAHHNAALQSQTGRNRGSIERKYMNISAVMERLGLPRIKGYAPYANFQAGLLRAVERYLTTEERSGGDIIPSTPLKIAEARPLWIGPPPVCPPTHETTTPELERLVRKFDPAARDARNRALGKQGEMLVLEHEIKKLALGNRADLASRVEWTSEEKGDGAGYDISSFEIDGRPRLIEVKTTNGTATTAFYLSENELRFSNEQPEHFKLVRVYKFSESPMAYELQPPLSAALTLSPLNYRATPLNN